MARYYSSVFIPQVTELWVDWFDLQENYLGSQELVAGPLKGIRRTGNMDYRSADRLI